MSQIPITKKTKMSELLHYRLKVSSIDGRSFIGNLLAFDKHMNLVLSDCEEVRIPKKSLQDLKKGVATEPRELKTNLGLIILRGDQIVNLTIQSPPVTNPKKRLGLEKGKGTSKPLKTPVSVKSKFKGFRGQ
ncbi:Small nuclear ribonucleoprotein-associated protein B [Yamadazyma tenuis]|uniref:Sm protein B n=1 Tax=Candida tenuis (strain ATCC 10573 / BCRC 21748 / CBS 615 / JCM 9827 / NBRC 10315 / NRRL Y-1498 / VKM Y-70) TaxID=590646 RepID=G3B0F6_CANTC|nr:Sm-like ribonucleoprotein [Yamadazyma tenuis ATCC 10573]EGV65389.1 Sm-like ribonucleo protein [Yamadazyma tenuis ATCC 10573]WEJ94941.1 Small nuclear ribonucleoprotein-associated protein B [Yamadazyma tenuis]